MSFERIVIEQVAPVAEAGRYPAKTVVGEHLPVRAVVWRDGYPPVTVAVRWTAPDGKHTLIPMTEDPGEPDVWRADVVATAPGDWTFQVTAWTDGEVRQYETAGTAYPVFAERERAAFGAWYEVFPRSTGGRDAEGRPVHGTLRTAAEDLPRIAALGFDVVHLTPIHPIGRRERKGRGNSPVAGPGDPGCPWAIGAAEGGHDAIHPDLGDEADFVAYADRARELGLEVALELAWQCAPDHPWLTEHPEWFTVRPDGTIACAENPPRVWTDIHPLNFDNDPEGLYAELRRIVAYWAGLGVTAFRVDNPHTKPAGFWQRLIADVKQAYPGVVFLAEAFTRPAVQQGLSRLGFDQTLTYFMWRETKAELTAFGADLVAGADFLRPNLFPSNHDVLPVHLHHQGPAMYAIRATLAATLGPSWGIYSGYEICESEPAAPGRPVPADAEKYELRPRDFEAARAAGRSAEDWITTLNRVRRAHPAWRSLRTLRFHPVDDDALIAYSKRDPETGGAVLCVVNLDPDGPRTGTVAVTPGDLGLGAGRLTDEISGQTLTWDGPLAVTLDPRQSVAALYRMEMITEVQEQA
ncbi:maltotransferase domain-containing protein [Hamadaea tsunoensis]|uniref:maltotransferase domain-containing protein n=1 Tax=Hamadaea tsunoensis TaxID=53368 RepID=UPI00041F6746|nr:maltotransferase domain-containing protein [Hamadaea tsunoensis]